METSATNKVRRPITTPISMKRYDDTVISLASLPNEAKEASIILEMEYIVKRELANLLVILDRIVLTSPSEHEKLNTSINKILIYINSLAKAELFLLDLNINGAYKYWQQLRSDEDQTLVNFILRCTTKLRLRYQKETDWNSLIQNLAASFSLSRSDSIIGSYDDDIKDLPLTEDKLTDLFKKNTWLVTLTLISLMDMIILDSN